MERQNPRAVKEAMGVDPDAPKRRRKRKAADRSEDEEDPETAAKDLEADTGDEGEGGGSPGAE